MTLFIYSLVLISLSIYSYSLIDPNITFFQTRWWEIFREKLVYFGYYQRETSWYVYLVLVILLYIFYIYFLKKYKRVNPIYLGLVIGFITLFSYPFLSHDFFNYMFDARIVTFYHQSPYLYKALDFPTDPWLRFLHWTHRTYPYGPVFLLITLIPSFLSFGKFVLSFFLFKATFIIFYLLAVFYLNKLNKKLAIIFATNPLVIIEGLVNSHNDLIGVSIAIIAIYFLFKKRTISRFFLVFSALIKYLTAPVIFISRDNKILNKIIFLCMLGLLIYLSLSSEIQPWYFLNLFIFLPFFVRSINRSDIFFFGLLVSYYPFIRLGAWDSPDKINYKHTIILFFLIVNVVYFLVQKFTEKKASEKE